jgi:hypothetical protein
MIYGIGLPRTGTSTLAEALRLLGLQGNSYCGLYNKQRVDKGADFIVNNTFYNRVDELLKMSNPEDKFILTTREYNSWKNSMSKFPEAEVIPDSEFFKTELFNKLAGRDLLIVSWGEGDCWKELCEFLDLPIPPYAFPCENC